jgi:GntP family gluconate:H+ symporter
MAIGTLIVVGGILVLRLHAFLALLLGAVAVAGLTPSDEPVGGRVAAAFGETCAKVGLLIALASIIGKVLLDTGGADRIVRSTLKVVGEKRAPLAFLAAGFILGIPVFIESVVLLMFPLAKAMAVRNEERYLLYILATVAGASMTHSLVPPTPGPTAAASLLGVDMGVMILGGLVVGAIASSAGYAYAFWANRRYRIPLRESGELSLAQLGALVAKSDDELPPLWLALAPIVLPAVLIGMGTAVEARMGDETPASWEVRLLRELGDKNVAMAVGAAAALATLVLQKRTERRELATGMQSALASAGVVILIIAAGGAFGAALEQSGVGERFQEIAEQYRIGALPLAFVVTVVIRTAQGSATVAMITAAGILKGFAADPAALGFHPVYLALAVGCGSKPFPWMNDAGFWLIGRTAGLSESETLKTSSTMIALMGCAGMAAVLALAWLFPNFGAGPYVAKG